MNIAMFADSYKPQINGMVTSIEIFTKYLRKKGHSAYVFAPEIKGAKKEKHVFSFRSLPFQAYREYRIGMPYEIPLRPEIKSIKFDVVHVHSPFSMGASGLGFAKYYRLPVVGTFHTLFPDYMHYAIRARKLQGMEIVKKIFHTTSWSFLRLFYNRCDVVIAPSEKIKELLISKGIGKKVIAIPTGIEIKKTKPKSKKSLREKYSKKYNFSDKKIILHVGRVTKEKNIKFIIDSLKNLLKKKNTIFVITSDGPYKEDLERYVKKIQLDGSVLFTGYLSGEELRDFYNLADLFVLASETETQGIVLAEAAINKLPIVTLDAPVTSDFVKENNIGVVSDSKNFPRDIEKMLNSKIAGQYIKNAERVEQKYNIEKCTDDLIEVYREAIICKNNHCQ